MAIIYIKDATRDKVEDIADAKRWSRATLIEVAIDEYIDRHGIERFHSKVCRNDDDPNESATA